MLTILCIETDFKGDAYLRECKRQGCTVLLLTVDSLADHAWPRESIDEIHTIPRHATDTDVKRRIEALIADYTERFYRDFFATAPPPERPVE